MNASVQDRAAARKSAPLAAPLLEVARALVARAERTQGPRMLAMPAPQLPLSELIALGRAAYPGGPTLAWAPPTGTTWVGMGAAARLSASRLSALSPQADALLQSIEEPAGVLSPRLFSAMRFEADRALAVLPQWRYERNERGAFLSLTVLGGASEAREALQRLSQAEPQGCEAGDWVEVDGEQKLYLEAVQAAVDAIARKEIEKVVLSRRIRLRGGPISIAALFERLGAEPRSTRFLLDEGEESFIGASPEALFEKSGLSLRTEALAGSALEVAQLRASEKDLREHRAVLDYIESRLEGLVRSLTYPASPDVRQLERIVHLLTPIRGELQEAVHPYELIDCLHPTPAVLGLPPEHAQRMVHQFESGPRGYYAGPVGWIDARGDGVFQVALRSARLTSARRGLSARTDAEIFVGAGIVRGSEPQRELAETQAKAGTMLRALGATA